VIPDGVATLSQRTTKTRADARSMLADANNTLRLPEWAPLAVYLGRLAGDRGLEYLVAAWPPIARQWPNARLWFVGEGPFRDSLRRQIAGLKLSGRAVLVGRFDHVEDLLAAADVLVYPGPRDGPSMAVAEAMGAGLPVIAADCVGHRILIEHDHTGLLVPPGSIEALSEALVRVFGDPIAADRLGRNAQAHARRHFALAQMVDQHVTLFKSLAPVPPK
jgi:glycosyltransferase involved in cell wall biosynthesis